MPKKNGRPNTRKRIASGSAPSLAKHEQASSDSWVEVLRQLDEQVEGPETGSAGYAEFELDFEHALARQLGPFFEKLPPLQLSPDNINSVVKPKARGAYYLLLDGELVYIGKSDAKAGLRTRLLRHYKTLKRRRGIDWEQMTFKAVKVGSLAALDTETLLLDLHKRLGRHKGSEERPVWNLSGFGSNDTGVNRDKQKVSIFDQLYPLDLDAVIEFETKPTEDSVPLSNYLKWLASQLSFTFRRGTPKSPRLVELTRVQISVSMMTRSPILRDLLLAIHDKLPADWVLTVLRGKVLLYHNDQNVYKSPLWRLASGRPAGEPDYTLGDVGTSAIGDGQENDEGGDSNED